MNSAEVTINYFSKKRVTVLPASQVLLLQGFVGFGVLCIVATIEQAVFNTILLLVLVSTSGLLLCRNTQIRLNDPSLKVLGYFWLIKLGITLLLLYVGWMPQLDPAAGSWGYDPQRFYFQAKELIDNNWSPDFISLNYVGILYYYGAIYYMLGYNPVIPALINAFVTLIASLYLVRIGYEVKGHRGAGDWTLAFALLLPELLWFDVMTSRETLMASLLLFAMLTVGRYLARISSISLSKAFTIVGVSVLAIAAVRTSMLVPVFASIMLMVVFIKPHSSPMLAQRTIMAVFAAALLIIGLVVNKYIGGYDFEVVKALQNAFSAKANVASGPDLSLGWSEKSIGLLLMPEGVLQSVLFLPARMVLYLIAPLPKIWVPIDNLVAGSYGAWQKLLTLPSSLINVFAMPYVLASLVQSIKMRKTNAAPLVFHIPYWITFMAIAGGNLIIQERYRIMSTLLLWGCAWLGARTCSKRLILRASLFWYGILALGALFYVTYKFGLV